MAPGHGVGLARPLSRYSETRWSFPLAHSSPRDDGALPRGSASRLAYLTGALARGSHQGP